MIIRHDLGLKQQWEPKEPQSNFPWLIWGSATGVGQALLQLAKKMDGYTDIIIVASKKHEEVLKLYSADDNLVRNIRDMYPNIQH